MKKTNSWINRVKQGSKIISSAPAFTGVIIGFVLGAVLPTYALLVSNVVTIGDLGEWMGSLATFLAVYVSLKLAADKKKMSFEVTFSVDTKKSRLILVVINTGSVPIYSLYVGIEAGILALGDFEVPNTINVFEKKRIVIDFKDADREAKKKNEAEHFIDELHLENSKQKERIRKTLQIQDAWDALTKMKDVEIVVDAGKVVKRIPRSQIHYDVLHI